MLTLMLGACDSAPEPATPAPEPDPTPAPEPDPTPARQLMDEHFTKATEARDAVIAGDIERAKSLMGWFADHDPSQALEPALAPHLERMRASARTFTETHSLTDAGRAMATMLTHCGACHVAADARPDLDSTSLPEGDGARPHMRRHAWAADRMWEGLVRDDADLFRRGTAALEGAPLGTEGIAAEEANAEQAGALAEHVHALATEAAAALDPPARAQIYGRYLAACAGCHRLLGRGPGQAPEAGAETADSP